jgi:hypothetical protein
MTLTIIISLAFVFIIGFIIGGVHATPSGPYPSDSLPNLPERKFQDSWEYAEMKSRISNLELNYKYTLEELRHYKINYDCSHFIDLRCFKCDDKKKYEDLQKKIKELIK